MKKKKPRKVKPPKQDGGLDPKTITRLRAAIRQVWSWSHARKLCIARATDKKGFGHCEQCRAKVPKLFADHIEVMGDLLAPDYIKRMWCPSKELQALCKGCHNKKTNQERDFAKYGF
jgi:hypothetical protein